MKAALPALLAGAVLSLPMVAQNITPEKVIDEYVKAMGGAKALGQIRTATITGNLVDEATGKSGSYSLILKSPNRFYSEIVMEPEREIEAYNGMSGWGQDSTNSARSLTGEAEKEAAASGQFWNGRLADAKKDKLTVRWIGAEPVRGKDAYHIQVTLPQGAKRDVFIDAQNHLIVRETAGGAQFDYEDYRAVNGIQAPFQIAIHQAAHVYKISLTRAEFNSPVDNAVFDFPKASVVALPDMKALFLELGKNQKEVEELRRQYTYRVTMETEANAKGKPSPKTIQVSEVFPIAGGGQVWHLIAKDGKPLEGNEKKKEDERFNKAYEERTKEAAKEQAKRAADPEKAAKAQAKEDAEDEQDISKILRAERFTNPRRERLHGQLVLAFDFGANPDYKPKSREEHIAQSLAGVVWVDEQAHEVVRLEAHFVDGVKIAGGLLASVDKGSNFVFEQTKVNDEVWLPSYTEIHIGARVLLFRGNGNVIQRFTDYKKFNAESKITIGQQ